MVTPHPLLTAFTSLSYFTNALLEFPDITAKINYVYLILISGSAFWGEPKVRQMYDFYYTYSESLFMYFNRIQMKGKVPDIWILCALIIYYAYNNYAYN